MCEENTTPVSLAKLVTAFAKAKLEMGKLVATEKANLFLLVPSQLKIQKFSHRRFVNAEFRMKCSTRNNMSEKRQLLLERERLVQ